MKVRIVGMGLAGSWMARELMQRGVDVSVVDIGGTETSSRVAAGLINPTTGLRSKSTWRSEVILPFAVDAYQKLAAECGVSLWSERSIRRIFLTEKDHQLWYEALERGVGVEWRPLNETAIDGIPLPNGGVEYQGATVDTDAVIDGIGEILERNQALVHAPYHHDGNSRDDVDLSIWCTGWHAAQHSLWSWLPFQPVKGEIIDVTIDGPPLTAVYIRGIWIVPDVKGLRIGATHDWDDLTDVPTAAARQQLVEKAQELLQREVKVVGQRAAVRPAAQSKRPYIGRHPVESRHAILNGLGTKGSLWAPWAACHLADHLLEGAPLDEEVNIMKWWKP